eukprot:gnl/TRDRNA2_/TRDRNA2_125349_c0_seq2.p1 gnl/TRDRNA2_/TRDRNA2_125349_c0~~gnl/TRDRNA2_/TRDRNA2_125349_c0_seq2.p1  ORF type:complete len:649 (-),score=122.47 gnl/TRDRNA2_/TRDRNA2_125349_c0_seq2:82-1905(-)
MDAVSGMKDISPPPVTLAAVTEMQRRQVEALTDVAKELNKLTTRSPPVKPPPIGGMRNLPPAPPEARVLVKSPGSTKETPRSGRKEIPLSPDSNDSRKERPKFHGTDTANSKRSKHSAGSYQEDVGPSSSIREWSQTRNTEFAFKDLMGGGKFRVQGTAQDGPHFVESLAAKLVDRYPSLEAYLSPEVWAEPRRRSMLAQIVGSDQFDSFTGFVVLVHSIITTVMADRNRQMLREEDAVWLRVMEAFFYFWYLGEVVLKLCVHRFYFFVNRDWRWNTFDFCLVCMNSVEQMTIILGGNEQAGTIRIVKLVKAIRCLRMLKVFTELRHMLHSLISSTISLFWSFIVVGFILYLFGLVFLQGVTGYLIYDAGDADPNSEHFQLLYTGFNTMIRTIITLYSAVTGGTDWMEIYQALRPLGSFYLGLFLFYTAFFIFAVFNVLTAIFVDNAVTLSQPDRDNMLSKQRRKEQAIADHLKLMIHEMDSDGDGQIGWDEFREVMEDPHVAPIMRAMGLDVKDAEQFYNVMLMTAHANGASISIDEFVDGCMKMRGQATSIDLQLLLYQTKQIQDNTKKFIDNFENKLRKVMTTKYDTSKPGSSSQSAPHLIVRE